jgi:hypothetical protein
VAFGAAAIVFAYVAVHDHDTGVPCGFHGLTKRVARVTFIHSAGQRQIHYPNYRGTVW